MTFEVVDSMRPSFDGVAVHPVCSTWTLAHYFELAGRKVLAEFLEPDEEGIGSHVSVDHVSPARVGRIVSVTATVAEVTDRRLICELQAKVGDRLVATGTTVQGIYPREVLRRLLERG